MVTMGKKLLLTLLLLALPATGIAASPGTFNATGEVRTLSLKTKTLSLLTDEGTMFFFFNDSTRYKNVKGIKSIADGDKVGVEYASGNNGNMALTVTRLVAELPPGAAAVSTRDMETLVKLGPEKGNYLLVDSRTAARYTQGHIRTSVSIPYGDLVANPGLLGTNRQRSLIFYCEGITCDLSTKSAAIALAAGYDNVRVFLEGVSGWNNTNCCIATSPEYIRTGNIVLIDLRRPDEVKKGHLPGAVNIPLRRLEQSEKLFPEYKRAAIVFYGNSIQDLQAATRIARNWQYTNVSAFPGGVDEWRAKGLKLEEGAAATTITYVRRLSPHEMDATTFGEIVATGAYQIIDVRSKGEYAMGHLPGAINVPLESLVSRVGEIARDKPVLLYCATGTRSEMAFEILKEKGLDLRYLNATIEFRNDSAYEVTG